MTCPHMISRSLSEDESSMRTAKVAIPQKPRPMPKERKQNHTDAANITAKIIIAMLCAVMP